MKEQRIGYIRIGRLDQHPEQQLAQVSVDRVFTDRRSCKDVPWPARDQALAFVRAGDTLVVQRMDRLARNLEELRRLVQHLTQCGVRITFVDKGLTFTGEDSPLMARMHALMDALVACERALRTERQREGIALARQRGVYRGRKQTLSPAQAAELRRRVEIGEPKAALAEEFGISRDTLYQYLKRGA
ncbi:MAG: recombinase family protein [Chloroflexales bacterium]